MKKTIIMCVVAFTVVVNINSLRASEIGGEHHAVVETASEEQPLRRLLSSEWIYGDKSDGELQYFRFGKLTHTEKWENNQIVRYDTYKHGVITYRLEQDNRGIHITQYTVAGIRDQQIIVKDKVITGIVQYDSKGLIDYSNTYYRGMKLKSESKYVDGVIDTTDSYDQQGNLTHTSYYQDGIITRDEYYSSDGKLLEKTINYKNGVKYNSVVYYEGSNKLMAKETFYTSGKYKGKLENHTDFAKSGEKTYSADYIGNKQLTTERFYKENSNKLSEVKEYENNKLAVDKLYYEDVNHIKYITKYDSSGARIQKTNYNKSGVRTEKFIFNPKSGRQVKKIIYKADGKHNAFVYKYEYGKKTQYLIYRTDGNGLKVRYSYYPSGALKTRQDYTLSGLISHQVNYDEQGVKLQMKTYSSSGEIKTRTVYRDGIRRNYFKFKKNGSYTDTFFSPDQKVLKVEYVNRNGRKYKIDNKVKTKRLPGYKLIKVDSCDMTTTRKPNVVVDVGVDTDYANRDYYGYTNKYGQLVKVQAAIVTGQNERYEPVVGGSNGKTSEQRYCPSEARVTGSGGDYDRGHVLADSLGGAANAYNITPEIEHLNLYGAQFQMEEYFRSAFKQTKAVTDFKMEISYPNKTTNIPDKYTVTFKIDGVKETHSVENK